MNNNKVNKIIKLITNNLGLKILAVVVSCVLWFVVNNITDPVDTKSFYNVQVEIQNADKIANEGKVYEVLDNSDIINVLKVTGKRSVLSYITKDDIKAVADMSELTFMNTVAIDISSTRNNSELEFVSSLDSVKLSIEDKKRIQMIISTSTSGEPADGYVVGSVTPSQNIVRIQGPESVINQIDRVEAVTSIDGYTTDINTSVELKLYDSEDKEIKNNSIEMNISTINVAVSILATKEIPLTFVTSNEPEAGYVVDGNITCSPQTVVIAGRKSVLDSITQLAILDSALNLEGKKEDFDTIVNIRKYLPTGTQFAEPSFGGNINVSVGIEPIVVKELEIPIRNFAISGKEDLDSKFDISLAEFEDDGVKEFVVKIAGTQAAVSAIKEESVIGVVDIKQIAEKMSIEEWAPGLYNGEITFNLPTNVKTDGSYTLTVAVKEKNKESEEVIAE